MFSAISSGVLTISKPFASSAKVQIFLGMRKVSVVSGMGGGVVVGGWELLRSWGSV